MQDKDRDYYLQRARVERELGVTSEDNAVAKAHLLMADEYERRARALKPQFDLIST